MKSPLALLAASMLTAGLAIPLGCDNAATHEHAPGQAGHGGAATTPTTGAAADHTGHVHGTVGAAAAGSGATTAPADASSAQKVAVANLQPSQAASTQPSWGKATGTVTFTQAGEKVTVAIDLQGVPPGPHGFHVHEKGDLSAPDLTSAGGHFNPDKHPHAGPDADKRHAGDLGNVEAGADGTVKKELTVDNITVGSGQPNDVVGKAVILHVKADDLKTQPTGDAGGRIAGGLIEIKK